MRPTLMTARTLFVLALALTLGLLLAAACGGDGGEQPPTGRLTDPRSAPTATPWTQPPAPIILEPGSLTPISGDQTEEEENGGEDGAEVTPGECGDTYTVESGDVPFTIAEKCGVDVDDLLRANPELTPTSLRVGDELNMPQ